jgi:hypothetical protein
MKQILLLLPVINLLIGGTIYSAGGTNIAKEPATAHWMKDSQDFLKNKKIFDIVLPGNHNAGSFNMSTEATPDAPTIIKTIERFRKAQLAVPIVGQIIGAIAGDIEKDALEFTRNWAQTQSMDIYHQLLGGIRYFDLRVLFDPKTNQYRFHHSVMGTNVEDALHQIKVFNLNNPEELILLEIDLSGTDKNSFNRFTELINKTFGDKMMTLDEASTKTFGDLVAKKHTIAVFLNNPFPLDRNIFWDKGLIKDHWANTDNYRKLVAAETDAVKNYQKSPTSFFKLQWVLTPQESTIERSISPASKIKTLKDLSQLCNRHLREFADGVKQYPINIFTVDFFDETDVVALAQERNKK